MTDFRHRKSLLSLSQSKRQLVVLLKMSSSCSRLTASKLVSERSRAGTYLDVPHGVAKRMVRGRPLEHNLTDLPASRRQNVLEIEMYLDLFAPAQRHQVVHIGAA